jgi:dehydrogenase/reductase SDR family member 4
LTQDKVLETCRTICCGFLFIGARLTTKTIKYYLHAHDKFSNSMKQFDLTGKVAIITGSSKGIGEAMAAALAEAGASVVISSRNQDAVDEVAASFRAQGWDATGIACHVADEDQRNQLVEKTVATYGRLDILINNAAINPVFGPVEDTTEAVFDKIMDVNVKAPWHLANQCLPYLKVQGGSIINIASVEGMHPGFGLGLYSVSKAALIMLTKNQAKEWGQYQVRSNALCPGLVKTKFSAALWQNEKLLGQLEKNIPAGRMALPEEMQGLALLLASDAGSYMTGGVYTADGGYLIAG